MEIKIYDSLPAEAAEVRRTVFMEEQGFKEEFDEIDAYAQHLVMYDGDVPVAVCRFFRKQDTESYVVGRIAVIKAYRGRNIGSEILKAVEQAVSEKGGDSISLLAQVRAKGFYEKQGYSSFGEIEPEEGCPHIWMSKHLEAL